MFKIQESLCKNADFWLFFKDLVILYLPSSMAEDVEVRQ